MVELSAIASLMIALQAAKDISQAMLGLRDAQVLQEKVIEFQSKISDAQGSAFRANDERSAMLERVRELEKQVADMQAWELEKEKYELKEVSTGTFAYALKGGGNTAEPAHLLCANCYHQQQRSILQQEHIATGRTEILVCHRCSAQVIIQGSRQSLPVKKPSCGFSRPKG